MIAIEESDRPFLLEAIRYCRVRRAMAWGDKDRAVWTRRIGINQEHLDMLDRT